MGRGLLSLATLLSLLRCVATAVLWARSYNVLYALSRRTVDRPSDLRATPGKCPECGATPSVSISG